jgi:serine phosphatase RsbU (regulator of sigma subunit)
MPIPGAGRILIVDDNQINRMILTRTLSEQGHQTVTAENGRQAIELLRADDSDGVSQFDVVLLDIVMPEMDGFATLAHIKSDAQLRNLPVIVISASDEMDSVIRCIEMGAEDFLPKPFNPILLRARIDASLEKKRLRDREQLYLRGLERELEIGRRIQASFLPDELPQPPGWEIAARFEPAREVAGDFYDAFPLASDGKIGLVVADVCDKGVGAALFMTLFRTLIRALASENFKTQSDCATELKHTIEQTNNYISTVHSRANMFATIFFAVLDPVTGALKYVNAGHEPPLILNAQGVKATLGRTGMVAGLIGQLAWSVQETGLAAGDTLFAFTDGIADAENARGESFTRERLQTLLLGADKSASEFLARIEANVRAHIAGANQFDDITMLAVRRRGGG